MFFTTSQNVDFTKQTYTKRIFFPFWADGGTAVFTKIEGSPEISMTGASSDYTRGNISVPTDYVPGTTARIIIITRSTNTQTLGSTHFIGARTIGSTWSSWNVVTNQTQANYTWTANIQQEFIISTTIPSANLGIGSLVAFAWKPNATIAGTIFVQSVLLEYTSYSR